MGGEKNDGQRVYLRKGARMQEWPGARRVNGGADTLAVFATPPTESQPAEDPRPSVPVKQDDSEFARSHSVQ